MTGLPGTTPGTGLTDPDGLFASARPRRQPPAPHVLLGSACVGLALAVWLRPPFVLLGLAVVGLGAVAALGPARSRTIALVGALLATGLGWGALRADRLDASSLAPLIGEVHEIEAVVTGAARAGRFDVRVPVDVRRVDARTVDEAAQLELPATDSVAPEPGDRLSFHATVVAPRPPDEPGGFDEAAILARRGAHVVLRARRFERIGRRGGLQGIGDRVRARIAASIAQGTSGERRALVAGIVLGQDEGLSDDLQERFRAAGLTHLLAVSGQNVAYVIAGVLLLAWVIGIPRAVAVGLALVAILGYVLAVGLQPSVVRAGIAGGLSCLAWLASRPRDRWYALLVAATALLAWNPYVLEDPGFQLSFAAVGAIFVCVPRVERRLEGYPIPARIASVLAVAAACGLATAPILWLRFGAVPLLTIPANAAAEPVVAPILALGLGTAALEPLLPSAAAGLGWVNGWLAAYLAGCGRLIGGLPFAQTRSPWVLLAIVAVGLSAWRISRIPRRLRRPALVGALAVALGAAGWLLVGAGAARTSPPSGLRISFLDVGQGDAALLEVPEGAVLIDQGPPEARVARLLDGRGVRRLSAVVLTHPQLDHIGGAPDVVGRIPVDLVLTSGQAGTSPEERAALAGARARGEQVVRARRGQVISIGRLRLEVLWPDGPGRPGEDPNQHAIVLLARYGEVEALFTADAESDVTGRLPIPPIDVLKVAHHGSADPGLADQLTRLRPSVAVISVGRGNDYGHPRPETLAALGGVRVFRTDRDGTVTVESDGSTVSVRSSR